MKYVQDERLNEKVAEVIEDLKEEIISNFHPQSIILSGSFGRGEVTVSEKNGKLKFLSDCEIIIIPYWHIFNRRKIEEFELNFYERTGLKIEIWGATLSFYLLLPFLNKKIKPTMANYDLKYGSKVLCGENYLERMPDFKPENIPLWEGIRLLFNRMAEALGHFSLEKPSEEMVFWTDKILLACQDALLLSIGKYHCSYRKRNEMFQNLFPERFGVLEDKLPNFLDLVTEATERKLNGNINVRDPVEYWFYVAEICDQSFRYVIKTDMRIEFMDYVEFQEKYVNHPKIIEYHPLFCNAILQNFWSALKQLIVYKRLSSIRLISNISIPWAHLVYPTIPLIYFSLSREKEINKKYLDQAMNIISMFGGESVDYNDSLECWRYAKKQVIEYWRQVCW